MQYCMSIYADVFQSTLSCVRPYAKVNPWFCLYASTHIHYDALCILLLSFRSFYFDLFSFFLNLPTITLLLPFYIASHPVPHRCFNIVRKSSGAILSLLYLLRHPGQTDLSESQSVEEAMAGVLERLMLKLTDDAADAYVRTLFSEAAKSIIPRVLEHMHRIAATFR